MKKYSVTKMYYTKMVYDVIDFITLLLFLLVKQLEKIKNVNQDYLYYIVLLCYYIVITLQTKIYFSINEKKQLENYARKHAQRFADQL